MINFGSASDYWWDSSHEEVRFKVGADGESVLCRISRETLEDYHGTSCKDGEQCLALARGISDRIEDAVGVRLSGPVREPDSSLLFRSGDI